MSTQGKRNYRPKIHFTPLAMWLNDPNGMVYIDGIYHLFYQYHPESTVWGPMHWGHAVSKNLIQWEHMPIALYPDELGYVFSGSCVYDVQNTSGFGTQEKPPMIAVFTSHDELMKLEQVSIAYSLDFSHFEKHYGNPVIHNPGIKDFRDPKVFWNSILSCWSLVIAAKDRVIFYCSQNLKSWKKTGEFLVANNGINGICECPDCFPVKTEGSIKWVLIISMTINDTDGNQCKTQYFVGTFNGNTFIETESEVDPLWLNYGTDYYAGVTYQNMDKPILMAWANNWAYANDVPTGEYCGQMSLATEVTLKKTRLGYRIACCPVGLEKLKENRFRIKKEENLLSQSFGLEIKGNGYGRITISNSACERLVIEITEDKIVVDRTNADSKNFSDKYMLPALSKVSVKRYQKGDYQMEILFDVSILEVFAEEGLIPITMSVYPENPYECLYMEGNIEATMYMF